MGRDQELALLRYGEAHSFLTAARGFAEAGGLRALPAHLDALEGRATIAAGDLDRGEDRLRRARDAFERLGARWDLARVELALAEAVAASRPAEALERLDAATRELERVGSRRELRRSRALRDRLG